MSSAAALFSMVIEATAASIHSWRALPFLMAVEITPVPRGLVSSKRSPGCAPRRNYPRGDLRRRRCADGDQPQSPVRFSQVFRRRCTDDLLDHFGGDVEKAIGAYNGGVRSPNPAYASSVKNIADYARRILEHATAQDDPDAKAKASDKSQPVAACKPAASGDAQSTNASGCVPPATPNPTTDATEKSAPLPKPPYRRSDD